jgi:hypothetical protein
MIKTLSPYYLNIPFVAPLSGLTCTEFTLKVYVWTGDKLSSPATSTWDITKKNPTGSTGNARFNVSNILSDFIQFTPQEGTGTSVLNGNNQRWIKFETYYQTADVEDSENPSNEIIKLALKGYAYGLDSENSSTPTNKVLLNGREFKVSRNSIFVLPVEIDQSVITLPSIVLNSVTPQGGNIFQYDFDLSDVISENIGLLYRQNGDVDWVASKFSLGVNSGNHTIDSNEITLTGSVDFAISFYYPELETQIFSNIITLSI